MWRRRAAWLLRLVLAATILGLVLRVVPLDAVARRTQEAATGPLLLALALSAAASVFHALRLWLLARALGLPATLATAAGVNLSALFYGLFLPGGNVTAGAIRFYRLAGSQRRLTAAAGAIAWDRLSATLAQCLVGLTCWSLAPDPKPLWAALALALGTAATLGLAGLGLLAKDSAPSAPSGTGAPPSRFRRAVLAVRNALREVVRIDPHAHAAVFGISIASQVLGTALYAALASALDMDISPLTIGWIRAAMLLLLLLPITISGLGVREGALLLLLTAEGVGQAPAAAFGVLVFAMTVLAPAFAGGVAEGIRLIARR